MLKKWLPMILAVVILLCSCGLAKYLHNATPEEVVAVLREAYPEYEVPEGTFTWGQLLVIMAGGLAAHEVRKLMRKWVNKDKPK